MLSMFDRVYVINLAHRADRRREMAAQLKRIGMSFGDRVELFDAVRPADNGQFPSIGAHGCFMSHLGVLRRAVAAGHRRILMLEDDVDFHPQRLSLVMDQLGVRPWSLAYGGGKPMTHVLAAGLLTEAPTNTHIVQAHFLALNGPVIAEIADYLTAMLKRPPGNREPGQHGPMHVDGAYSHFREEHPLHRTLLATPEVAHQRSSRTDIAENRWFDRWPLVRELASAARVVKRMTA